MFTTANLFLSAEDQVDLDDEDVDDEVYGMLSTTPWMMVTTKTYRNNSPLVVLSCRNMLIYKERNYTLLTGSKERMELISRISLLILLEKRKGYRSYIINEDPRTKE